MGMFAHCKSPVWREGDFSRCFEQDYLQTLFPLIVCGGSLIFLIYQLIQAGLRSRYYLAYKSLDTSHIWTVRSQNGYRTGARDSVPDLDEDEESEDEGDLMLQQTLTRESVVEVDKPKGEVTLVILEELCILAEWGIHIAVLATGAWGRHRGRTAAIAGVVTWTYVVILASTRLFFSISRRASFPPLWYHTAYIYSLLWVLTTLMFRSAVIYPRSGLAATLQIVDFSLVSVLLLIALTSRKGNRPIEVEYEGDLEPSKELTASVFSLATFGWVDPIVWRGFKKTFELSDVWNLAPKDKADAILSEYRQVKKTTTLAWHLLGHFKIMLFTQFAWAVLSGLLTFAPTLLLKAILEYVESPDRTPAVGAWFFVILLFVSGCAAALADGQALFTGRKICIRLRAIIVGEIYAKALKRRVAAGSDKVLGQEGKKENKKPAKPKEDEDVDPKRKLAKRMMSYGRKQKSADLKQDDPKQEDQKKSEGEGQVTSGTIINLMAVDSFKLAEISAYLHFLVASAPVQIIVAVGLLYSVLGNSSLAGIGMMAVLLPINLYVSKKFASIQKQILAATDARIHTTNEVLNNIRIIKYFAWEQRFMAQVDEKRAVELRHIRRRYTVWAIAATIWSGAPVLITFLSFLVYTLVEKKDLIPSVAFTALSLFQILRIPLDQIADMVAHVQESKVSVDRIEEYLNEPETDKYKQLKHVQMDQDGEPFIGFDNATFSWGSKEAEGEEAENAFQMRDLDLHFHVGQLNIIAGPTGCGKTSLLMALLGEMTKMKGEVFLPGAKSREELKADPQTGLTDSVAYCAQQAWLMNGTIKDNILFASPLDPQRYKEVIAACSLQRDIEILDHGDKTLVGEKGVTLSGGQKQRISLARALYSKARHILLDDVLSAVDSHTAKWIFEQALMGPLMHHRTCILVTHNVALCLPHAEFAVVLDNGRVVAQGTANEVITSGKLGEDLTKSRPGSRGASAIPSRVQSSVAVEEGDANGKPNGLLPNGDANGTALSKQKSAVSQVMDEQAEKKATGRVKFTLIFMYLRAMGPWWYWIIAGAVFAAQQASSVATNVWIREWANAYARNRIDITGVHHSSKVTRVGSLSGLGTCLRSGTCVWNGFYSPWQTSATRNGQIAIASAEVDSGYYLGVYALLGLVFMIITLSREGVVFGGSLNASRKIHTRLIQSITHAKFRFFDTTPLGQLMNRFSKDIESVDQEIAPIAVGVVHCLASIITIVVLISVITPGFLIAGAFITVLYFLIGMFYINSSRDLKRLESTQRSPLYQQFGETLSGMTTIRAYGDERRFIRDNLNRVNTHNRPFIYLWATNRWLAFRVDVVGALVSFFSGVFVVLSVGTIDAGAAGLALTYAVTFTENVLWFVRLYAANEQNMNSVERIKEYLDVEQEAPPIIPENRPPANWPSQGAVEFIGYGTRYRKDFDMVLKHITFKIAPGEKVGIVGRTGAGKSSLALALFRALEAEEGKILVDDVDIGKIGLQDLRENIVMVPQDPTLFTGTVRSNLDPFGLFTDEEIFTTLRSVQLIGSAPTTQTSTPTTTVNKNSLPGTGTGTAASGSGSSSSTTVVDTPSLDSATTAPPIPENKNLFNNLHSPVAESGSNLSQGQRQLLCLARALLKAPKVLLMDEATASIDYATDSKIQETIREIRNTTITIAHRLQTIIDYDKVLVLDRGEVVEYGSPWDLLQGKGETISEMHVFKGMCEMTGEYESLEKVAKEAWRKKEKPLVDDST